MPRFLRDNYVNLLTSGSHLVLLLVAVRINERPAWTVCFALIAGISFFAWVSNFRRGRVIADTPTSKIGSAAQGYVELYGRANGNKKLVQAKGGSFPGVWYRCTTYRLNSDRKWVASDHVVSESIFEINDGSGVCMVDPDHAEVITTHTRTWYEGEYRHVEEQLFASDRIYVLGEFHTMGGAHTHLSHKEDVSALLAAWKRDPEHLLKRFDLNSDGEIDIREWELARKAAAREVERNHRELRQQPGVHVMRRPVSGRMYLISNLSPHQLKRKYQLWGAFHISVFFAGLAAVIWLGVG
ncbi:MAG: hypothetical protein ACAH06_07015 [Methylophilaceae bacterium]|jgi:hypothetical protein|uniref:hypothetical protein n=1 Tax=Methylobacillus sp. MM3 TaxID=1848039 RepID=UPI0007DF0963|nr:hypothetical protein [Methylobacillus sp. MM3]OAJ70551.1 hypothetical protein A7976_02855 [Methylobacillus sp. MM3]